MSRPSATEARLAQERDEAREDAATLRTYIAEWRSTVLALREELATVTAERDELRASLARAWDEPPAPPPAPPPVTPSCASQLSSAPIPAVHGRLPKLPQLRVLVEQQSIEARAKGQPSIAVICWGCWGEIPRARGTTHHDASCRQRSSRDRRRDWGALSHVSSEALAEIAKGPVTVKRLSELVGIDFRDGRAPV